MPTLFRSLLHSVFTSISVSVFFVSCWSRQIKQDDGQALAEGTKEGYTLAKTNCSACHSFVPAETLDKITWQDKVLPGMAPNLGIGVFGATDYINNPDNKSAKVSFENWMKIVNYYITNAPDTLTPAKPPVPVIKDWSVFDFKKPGHSILPSARTTMVSADTSANYFYTGDGNTNFLYRWNSKLELVDSTYISSPPVSGNFFFDKNGRRKAVFSTLGTMEAKDISEGNLFQFDVSGKLNEPEDTLAKKLPRPVQIASGDFNKDGLRDWVVCGFGHNKGGLYWLEQLPKGGYKKNSIVEIPGAIQSIVQDFNGDGWDDLMVLFAHDDESILLFINDHQGSFTSSRILTFPPVYGSSSFQLADFNKDGLPDILYTCGDNADLSPILKPFHGMYIYLNRGKMETGQSNVKYELSYFYPINGCTKAIAADFDNDGDLDIATIAFFADFKNNPGEKFLYFEQVKSMHFLPHSPPIEHNGRWICMDVADYDKDGDLDIILGNFAHGFVIQKNYRADWDATTPFVVLENKTVERK